MRTFLHSTALIVLMVGCQKSDEGPPNPNVVSDKVLAPRLLHDEAEMKSYLAAFPAGDYKVHDVFGQGSFYLDDVQDTIKDFLRKGIRWETHIDDLLRAHVRRNTTMIDVGAHIGTHAVRIANYVGRDGRVYAFEPQRKIFRELVRNIALNELSNVVPLRFALGDKPGIIEMNPAPQGNEGHTMVGHGGDRAELRTLDSFQFTNVSVVKIDVEGFEDAVLDGARATLAANRPVLIVEIQGGEDYETTTPEIRAKIDATKQKMVDLGYAVTKVSPHDYLGLPQ